MQNYNASFAEESGGHGGGYRSKPANRQSAPRLSEAFGLAARPGSARALFWSRGPAKAAEERHYGRHRHLAAAATAELIEADLWEQYAELGGLTPGQLPVRRTRRSRL